MHLRTLLLIFFLACSSAAFAGGDPDLIMMKELNGIESRLESEPEESIKTLDKLIKEAIRNDYKQSLPFAYTLMGRAYVVLEQPELALHFIQQAEEIYGSQSIPLERMKTAITSQAGEMDESPSAVEMRSSSYNGEKNEAKKSKVALKSRSYEPLSKSLSTPETPSLYFKTMAEVHQRLERYDEANDWYDQYKRTTTNEAELKKADYARGENFYKSGNFEAAIAVYEDLLKRETRDGNEVGRQECQSNLAACYISQGNTNKGLEFYGNSMAQPEDSYSNEVFKEQVKKGSEKVSGALRSQGKYQEEIDVRNQNLQVLKEGVEYLRLAQTYYKEGDFKKAESSIDKFLNDISYELVDAKEVEVIRLLSERIEARSDYKKAFQYITSYQNLTDSIGKRRGALEARSEKLGAVGRESLLELEVLKKDQELSQNTIDFLMRESNLKEDVVSFQRYLIYGLILVLLAASGGLIYIMRVSKQRRIANQQLALRSLRSQMNPHFIFNALNSVNSFISLSDERSANKFLSEFSKLMRTVMENSEHDLISLAKELEILRIYLELEHFRFKDKFSYQLNLPEGIDEEAYELPPMLIQPYIENAIWHGLRYKEELGELSVSFSEEGGKLKVQIRDNGIGRAKSLEIKTKNQLKTKSTAMKNIGERIRIFNDLHKMKIEVEVKDVNADGSGTLVELIIPQNSKA